MRDRERAAFERLGRLGGERFARDMATLYVEQTSERLATARTALAERDAAGVAATAHSIRSSSAQLGAEELVATCECLEDDAERGDLTRAAEHLALLEQEFDALRTRLLDYAAGLDATAVARPASQAPRVPSPDLTIAVVEDNADNRLLIDAILGDRYALQEYETGAEALAGMAVHPPSLVLLDVSLPGLDGLDVLQRIRGDAALRHVPVVAVTAHAMAGDRERYLLAGFDGYVPKPIVDERVLIETIERLLRARRGPPHDGEARH